METSEITNETAEQLARDDAALIVAAARESQTPVVWITGNAYMPPIRDLPNAEACWLADEDGGERFETYIETLEAELDAAEVLLTGPEYDNALYVVDLARWRYRDDADDVEYLSDEWEVV